MIVSGKFWLLFRLWLVTETIHFFRGMVQPHSIPYREKSDICSIRRRVRRTLEWEGPNYPRHLMRCISLHQTVLIAKAYSDQRMRDFKILDVLVAFLDLLLCCLALLVYNYTGISSCFVFI